jgi:hypothetical protein
VPKPDIDAGAPSKNVIIKELGDAGNAWGLSSGARTFMWANNDINSVVFAHRMLNPPGTGFLAYDVSTDGGDSWEVNHQVWDPALYPAGATNGNARYPQVVIYNPEGNTDPANAIMTYYAPVLAGTNGGWGGYARGTNMLTAVNPTAPTAVGVPQPGNNVLYSVPDAFTITADGKAISYEPAIGEGQFVNYNGYLVYNSGYYNESTMLFEYEEELIDFDITAGGDEVTIPSQKIAFHPDGQVGYMAMLTNNGENDVADFCYYPVLFKTENGGEDWDGPFNVQLGGPDGLPAVLNYLSDEKLGLMFDPVPLREEILFTTAFDMALAVDMNGDPHLLFVVGVRGSDNWSIGSSIDGLPGAGGTLALVHAASYDGMTTWYADTVTTPYTFRGEFDGDNVLSEDLRPYIAATPDASKLFFSWQNTEIPDIDDNLAPDIYCQGYRVADHAYTQVFNVTAFTDIMWQAWMATGSYWVFDDGNGNYEIPFVSQIMNPDNNLDPVAFRYVDNFVISDEDFLFVSTPELEDKDVISISKNYPNPASAVTKVNVTLEENASLQLEISNLLGQKVRNLNLGHYTKGLHTISINVADLDGGIYIYTLSTGADAVAGKMIVE